MLGDHQSNNTWLQSFINQIPLDGGTVTEKCLSCLAVRVLTLNVRGIGL